MFASAAFLALAVSIAQAAVSPLTPATIQEGQQLQVQWFVNMLLCRRSELTLYFCFPGLQTLLALGPTFLLR